MKILSKISLCLMVAVFGLVSLNSAQAQTKYPRASQKAMLMQTVGDTDIMISYHRPNIKERKIWGGKDEKALVPYGEVWRAGANEATVFEVTNDVMINGKKLPKGKYSFYAIPSDNEWTLIFNKEWDQWGTIYDEKKDEIRVMVKPVMSDASIESLRYTVENVTGNTADVHLAWGKARVPFTVDIGDVNARLIKSAMQTITTERLSAANYIFTTKQDDKYKMAIAWLDSVLADGENYGAYFVKARLLAEMGMKTEAIEAAKKGVAFGKANNVNPRSVSFLEGLMNTWMSE